MVSFHISQTADLSRPSDVAEHSAIPVRSGDDSAHVWTVTLTDGERRPDLSGAAASCWFIRPDGTTAVIDGSIKKNVLTVTFGPDAYSVEGLTTALMKITIDGKTVTVAACSLLIEAGAVGKIVDVSAGEGLKDLAALNRAFDDFTAEVDGKIARFGDLENALTADTASKTVTLTNGWTFDGMTDIQFGCTSKSEPYQPAPGVSDFQIAFPRAFKATPAVLINIHTASTSTQIASISAVVLEDSITPNGFSVRVYNAADRARGMRIMWFAAAGTDPGVSPVNL